MNQLSRTKLKERKRRKTSPELIKTIDLAMKNPSWNFLVKELSSSTRKTPSVNLKDIDAKVKTGDTIVITGKILSKGDLTKKIRICALSISQSALERLKESKSEFIKLKEEIIKNKKAEGIKLIK